MTFKSPAISAPASDALCRQEWPLFGAAFVLGDCSGAVPCLEWKFTLMKRAVSVLLFLGAICAAATFGSDKQFCDVSFVVLKDGNGKPVKYASVVLHAVDSKGKQLREGLQLKTDGEGKAQAGGVPYGKVRVQVIARGLQTFGQDYQLGEPSKEITIKLKQPQGQYSIYDDHGKNDDEKPDQKPPVLNQ
jgi:hypothetical protein